MEKRYYFDTSIWLDLFENRDEPNRPKGKQIRDLVKKIIQENDIILFSDQNFVELNDLGYPVWEIKNRLGELEMMILFIEATKKETSKARDLSKKRGVPRGDAVHALLARRYNAIFIALDRDFQQLLDIVSPWRPQDLTS